MAGITWHYVLKFIITGDPAVGKSSLLVRLTDQRFLANPDPTLGVEFGSKLITIPEDNKVIKLQCWDTAGQETFRAITRSYYRGAAGCLLVYDVTSRESFEHIQTWLADVRKHADPHVSCILVGNKVDLCEDTDPSPPLDGMTASTSGSGVTFTTTPANFSTIKPTKSSISPSKMKRKAREVSYEEADLFAKQEGMLFVEASAKSGLHVEQAFVDASRDILEKIKKGVFDDDRSPGVKQSQPNTNLTLEGGTAKSSCCT
ncbi:ras-domain-containing protein [Gymnopilus junonius]|uniref:Ras-domain-containing protein n=1 Tax=Gymnopilus junonius TaxID=109634 RepID=A0A9P5NSA5_GYMJU|nr:ras-domain-containing protein [Gymnopilus junonius]